MPWLPGARPIRQSVSWTRISGDLNQTVHYNVITQDGFRGEFRLAPFSPELPGAPAVEVARAQPSRLLDARLGVVAFTRRDRELAVLQAWREQDTDARAEAFLIDGEGGSGKTRLARQFARLSGQDGWAVWEAAHDPAASPAELPGRLAAHRQRGILLLVDYAERWPAAQLLALARHVRAASPDLPLRLLLLSRSAGDWWEMLAHRLMRQDIGPQARHLQPLSAGPSGAGLLFRAARDRFAQVLGVPGADAIEVPDLTHDDFGLVLAVHMAALVAVDARLHDARVPADPARLSDYLLRRERDAWHSLPPDVNQRPRSDGRALGRAVYTAVLSGPLPRPEAERALGRTRLAGTPESAARLLDDHRVLYPTRQPGTDLEPLYPDRLAEDFLALTTPGGSGTSALADPWAAGVPALLLAPDDPRDPPPSWSRTGITVLIQAAARWDHLRTGTLYPLLRSHPRLAVQAGSAALSALSEFGDLDPGVLDAIEPFLPEDRDFETDLAMAALTRRVEPRRLAAAGTPAEQAALRTRFGRRYSAAGLHDLAAAQFQAAADAYRTLARKDPRAYQAGLAEALDLLSREQAALGQRQRALALAEEAVELLRTAGQETGQPVALLVNAQVNRAGRLAALGRHEEDLTVLRETLVLARRLAADGGEDSLGHLTQCLTELGDSLRTAGHVAEALPVAQEAADLARRLVETRRNAHLALLAHALRNLGKTLADADQGPAGIEAARESADLYQLLASTNPNVFLESLSVALSEYAVFLRQGGRAVEELDTAGEALAIQRGLSAADPGRHGLLYAAMLCDYSDALAADREDEAVTVAREALALVRSLPGMGRAEIAMVTWTLGKRLSGPAAAEGLSLTEEAVALLREAVKSGSDTLVPDLADVLYTLCQKHDDLGQHDAARAAVQESVDLLRPLAGSRRVNRRGTLAHALAALEELGALLRHPPVAVSPATDPPGSGLPDLPYVLRMHANLLVHMRRESEAEAIFREVLIRERADERVAKALTPSGRLVRRILEFGNLTDPDLRGGGEALAITAITSPYDSVEQASAIRGLRIRRWSEKHPIRPLPFLRRREEHPGRVPSAAASPGPGPTAESLLADVTAFRAADPAAVAYSRVDSARELVRLKDPRGIPYLVALAQDPLLHRRYRENAARALGKAGDPRGRLLLAEIRASQAAGTADSGTAPGEPPETGIAEWPLTAPPWAGRPGRR